jgi:HEAT repeat protein
VLPPFRAASSLALVLLALTCLLVAPGFSAPAADLSKLPSYDYSTSFEPLTQLDALIAQTGKDPAKNAELTARLTELLRQPACTFAARQAICERLSRVLADSQEETLPASHPTLALLAPWLEDATLAPLALLALERVPGPAIDQLLQAAAQRAKPPTRQALLNCLERRHRGLSPLAPPTPELASLLADLESADFGKVERALSLLASLPADKTAAALAPKVASYPTGTQYAVIVLLGRLGQASAVPALLDATGQSEASLRLAALNALGLLPGTPECARRLVDIASTRPIDESKVALAALARLNGPGITEFLLAGSREGPTPARVVCLRSLASRNTLEGLPLLYQCLNDTTPAVRLAAIDALAAIAPFSEQARLLDWTFQTSDRQDLARAQRALISVTQRAPDPVAGILPLLAALEKAKPAVQIRNIGMLIRLGDEASLACAARLATEGAPEVSTAAISTLARWPDPKALLPLSKIAAGASDGKLRASAFSASLDLLRQKRGILSSAQSSLLPALLTAALTPEQRQQFLALLARAADEKSARLAESLAADPALAANARLAAENIRANLRWPPAFTASGATASLKNLTDGKPESSWGVSARPGEWLQIDFKVVRPLSCLILSYKEHEGDYPESFEVYVGNDAKQLGKALLKGEGSTGETLIQLPPGTRGRYVRIVHTADRASSSWQICELQVE